jgi:hypothetical protein
MRRKTNTRRNRKKNGGGCGCGGMEMLGFPKSGGFMGLFGGEEQAKPVETMAQPSTVSTPVETMAQPSTISTPVETMPTAQTMPTLTTPIVEPKSSPISRTVLMNQNSITPLQKPIKNNGEIVTEIKNLKSDLTNIKQQLTKLNTSFNVNNSPGLFGGYRATKKNKKYLKMYKQKKSIGFTMRSSLKAKGLIPRANGTYKISKKYRG